MMKVSDGGPAFPRPIGGSETEDDGGIYNTEQDGMSLRDWFAGQALGVMTVVSSGPVLDAQSTAEHAYEIADAMLVRRARDRGPSGEDK